MPRKLNPVSSREAVVLPLTRGAAPELALDRDLIERALGGERGALQLLYRRHVQAVTERVTRLLSRSAEAEDVVQDVFVAAFDDLPQLADRSRFGAWLMGIAVHQVHRRFRRRRLLARLGLDRGSDDARLEQIADPALSPEARAQLGRLDRALTALPAELRLAWMLRYVEGCELLETAEQCRCSLATIKRRLARADASLKSALDAEVGGAHE
jgi:RNA polymerase sigma-70 factor, ECF subfamily